MSLIANIGSFGAAAAEAEGDRDVFTFYGEDFKIADRIGVMPLMRFAKTAKLDSNANDMDGLVAMYDLIRDCLADPAEWGRFEEVAMVNRAEAEEILEICQAIYAALSARPTKRRSDSSDGPSTTSPSSSPEPSRSPAIAKLPPEMASLVLVPNAGGLDLGDLSDTDEEEEPPGVLAVTG